MRRLNISHVTEYLFAAPVSLLPHRLLLRPRENHNVRIESSTLDIFPGHLLQWKRDVLDNSMALVSFVEPSDRVRFASNVVIQHYEDNPFDFLVDDYAVIHPFDYNQAELPDLVPFLQSIHPSGTEAVRCWLEGLGLLQSMETFVLVDRMNREIASRFFYQMREEEGVQPRADLVAQQRVLQGFRGLVDGGMQVPWAGQPVRQRLSLLGGHRGAELFDPCLGRGLSARRRLEGIRSHQRRGGGQSAHRHGRGPSPGSRTAGGRQLHRPPWPDTLAQSVGAGQLAPGVTRVGVQPWRVQRCAIFLAVGRHGTPSPSWPGG